MDVMLMERLKVLIPEKRGDITGQELVTQRLGAKTYGCSLFRHKNKCRGLEGGMTLFFLGPK